MSETDFVLLMHVFVVIIVELTNCTFQFKIVNKYNSPVMQKHPDFQRFNTFNI